MKLPIAEILELTWWNNTVYDYLISFGIFLVLFAVFLFFDFYLIFKLEKLAKKTETQWDDLVIDLLKEIKWFFYLLLSIYFAIKYININSTINNISYYLVIIFAGYYIAKGISSAINHFIEIHVEKNENKKDASSSSMMRLLGNIAKGIIWVIALLMILSNAGIEITPMIASLGIGGIAIALALQSVLADLFGAFVIYFDKPFKEGDFIIVGNDMGVVKHIGIKSTRIQALQGQELVMSNTELVNSRVNNYKQMEKRRIAFSFGVKYDTGIKKLNKIKEIVKHIFEKVENADLDRVHFKAFGDFSLNYEVVYYVMSSDYNQYMDIQEQVNLKLYEDFEKSKIEFAFPTQTIEIAKK
jgi:small-conductance mechanosensitive channel